MAAVETGAFDGEIEEAIFFDELTDFSDYINAFYEEKVRAKETGDTAGYWFAKLFMNSLYGKFGANPEEYKNYKVADYWMLDEKGQADEWTFAGEWGEQCLISKPQDDEARRYYNIATAASITGFVRAMLWQAITRCRGAVYCDTDSIAARDVSGLPYGDKLGEWELEGRYDYAAIGGRKLYAMRRIEPDPKKDGDAAWWKIACKGVKLTPQQIARVARGEVVTYEPMAPVYSVHTAPRFINRAVSMTRKTLADVESQA